MSNTGWQVVCTEFSTDISCQTPGKPLPDFSQIFPQADKRPSSSANTQAKTMLTAAPSSETVITIGLQLDRSKMFFHIFCCGRTHERHETLHWVNEHTILCFKMSLLVHANVGLTPWKQLFAVPLFMI